MIMLLKTIKNNIKLRTFTAIALLVIFIVLRIKVRTLNPLWVDEISEINNSLSLKQLILHYLPGIPGGSPGHYLLVLLIKSVFPNNNTVLYLPGLISQISVFILIPLLIEKLRIVRKKQIFIASTVARVLFILDPSLTFQAVEVRPYSMFPFLWIVSLFIVLSIISVDRLYIHSLGACRYHVLLFICLLIIFNWHYYGALMIISIYLFILLKEPDFLIKKIFSRKSARIIFFSLLLSIPVWKYFSPGSFAFNINTLETVSLTIQQMYSINKGFPKGIIIQNTLYFIILLISLLIGILVLWSFFQKNNQYFHKSIRNAFIRMNVFLVLLPLGIIFVLDWIFGYWFLLRQFAWIMLPFYISIGVVISGINKFEKLCDIT